MDSEALENKQVMKKPKVTISDEEFRQLGFKEDSKYGGIWSRPYNDPFPFELYVENGLLIGIINREYRVINVENKIRATKANVERLLELFCPQFNKK